MTFEIRINIDAPRAGLRRLVLFVGLPVALVGVTAAIAHAYDTSFAAAGQQVKATSLKTALDDIQSRLVALESPVNHTVITYGNGAQYSLGATFKTITPGPYDGLFLSPSGKTGYAAAKEICEIVTSSKSAHMCTSDEAVRSAATGNPIVGNPSFGFYSWISTGVFSYTGKPGPYMSDCQGFTTASSGEFANTYYGGVYPWPASCDGKYPIACCDLRGGPGPPRNTVSSPASVGSLTASSLRTPRAPRVAIPSRLVPCARASSFSCRSASSRVSRSSGSRRSGWRPRLPAKAVWPSRQAHVHRHGRPARPLRPAEGRSRSPRGGPASGWCAPMRPIR